MRRSALVSAVVFLILGAANTPAQQTPFRADVSLVTIDVTVLDKDGKPVPGLSSEDFQIKLNGKAQPVRAIAFLQAASPGDVPAKPVTPAISAPAVAAPKPAAMLVAKEVEVRRTISNQDNLTATGSGIAPANPAPAAPAAPAATSAPQTRVAGNIEPRVFVLLIDDLSFTALRGKALFASAQKFVDSVPASDPVGFTTTSGSATVNPTMDRAAVKAGLAKVVGEFYDPRDIRKGDPSKGGKDGPIGMDEAIDIDRGDDTLLMSVIVRECFSGNRNDPAVLGRSVQEVIAGMGASPQQSGCASDVASEAKRTAALMRLQKGRQLGALTGVINAMRTASGIRHLVYVTDGMAVSRDVVDLKPITSVAAAAGVQFSVIMEDPDAINMNTMGRFVPTDGSAQQDTPSQRIREDNKLMLNGAQTFTDVVGGIFYKVVGNADRQFERVLLASSAVYRLGVELPPNTAPGKELTLSAEVRRPGLTIRSNRVAVNAPAPAPANPAPAAPAAPAATSAPAAPPPVDDILRAALNENRSLRGVPIRLAATVRRSASAAGQVDVSVNVLLPASVKTPITMLIGLVDETNAMRVSRRVADNAQQTVQFLFPVAPGSYAIRFGAAGADGALGTIELPIAAKLHAMGAFTTSDVLTYVVGETSQKATLFTTDDVPSFVERSTYHASIEFYPTGAMPSEPPVVAWTIVREGETKPVFEEETEGRVGTNLFRADVEIPFATLPPGTYVVRATLLVDDKPAGSVGAVLRKK